MVHQPTSFVSILVTIVNHTDFRFVRSSFDRSSGEYTVEPPFYIEAGDRGTFCIESAGFMTGAVGAMTYKMDKQGGTCQFDYSAPFIGANTYSSVCPKGYYVERSGGTGYAAEVTFIVRKV
jgi:hypothetical protein